MSIARIPELGRKPVELSVDLGPLREAAPAPLSHGFRDLYRTGEFADVVLLCGDQRFLAHRLVLASRSFVFKYGLSQPPPQFSMRHEIRLSDIAKPEAVRGMLDYLYQCETDDLAMRAASGHEITRDILRLAKQFELSGLTQKAACYLTQALSTGNVVERLAICDEFKLAELKEKILEALTTNKVALAQVASNPQIMTQPGIMQAILQRAAGGLESSPEPQEPKTKRARKG